MSSSDKPTLSIVVPAYNEAERLPRTLAAIEQFVSESGTCSEVILANDGSSDDTSAIAGATCLEAATLTILDLPHRGKAATVRDGVLAARGEYVLFTDADLSTPMHHVTDLLAALSSGAEVAIGSREGIGATRVGEPRYRHLMGRIFNTVVRLLAVPGINDTQCGFKAFRGDAAREIFGRTQLHTGGGVVTGPKVTGFDVEVLYLARKLGYTIVEVPVYWEHVTGSKVQPARDSVRMFLDVVRVRWNALRGRYG